MRIFEDILFSIFAGIIMDRFVLWGEYCENALEKRSPFREGHLDRHSVLKEDGMLITLGPTKCNRYVFGIFK